jgi:hypothetical protein
VSRATANQTGQGENDDQCFHVMSFHFYGMNQ